MPIQCRLTDGTGRKQPGDMFYGYKPNPDDDWCLRQLSDEYKRDGLGKRPVIMVILPNGYEFCVDWKASGKTTGWTVIGEPPNITVSPSINHRPGKPDGWHGFLQNGILTDDLEGRKYGG